MRERILKSPVRACLVIFCLLIAAHGFEAIVLRMDETFFAENFINKLFGIAVLGALLRVLGWGPGEIGFSREGFWKSAALGLGLGAASFALAYSAELIILGAQGHSAELGFFTSGFSLTGGAVIRRGTGFILMCVFFNVINVLMEEGTFRGLFYRLMTGARPPGYALFFQALLFGVWHIVTPLHGLIDGDMGPGAFAGLSIGYIILAGLMGVKWGLMYRMTGSLYAGMADHFFNNCIATNLVHVVTESGTDELMTVRVLSAQLISFGAVLAVYKRKQK